METKSLTMRHGLFEVRYLRAGKGTPMLFLHDVLGLDSEAPELDALARKFDLIAPFHPGFGSGGIESLREDVLALTLYTWDIIDALKIERAILVGAGFGGMVAAEMAAIEPARVQRLVLAAPMGLYIGEQPTADIFTMTREELVANSFFNPESPRARALSAVPADHNEAQEVNLRHVSELSAVGRFVWPLGDRGLADRLYRIKSPTLLLWGEADRIIPLSYAQAFARGLESAARVDTSVISNAGHMVTAERPEEASDIIAKFCSS